MKKNWFTLVEIMIWILIFSIVIIWWFKAYSWVLVWKIKLIESTDIQKQAFYFSEKFFEEIKKWWTIDYEEYFNRTVVWTDISNGHYKYPTWFWNYWKDWVLKKDWTNNYWKSIYHCRSNNWTSMWTWWCVSNFHVWNFSYSGSYQRYNEYSLQFIDLNSNFDDDKDNNWNTLLWDEDWDWVRYWDDDDEYLWIWPVAFQWNEVNEIYLISANKIKRTYFRWRTFPDEWKNTEKRGTIEILKLEWKDWWRDHIFWWPWPTQSDWIVDTWIFDKNFTGWSEIIAWSDWKNYWQPLFWKNINVSDVRFYLYPNKDLSLSWKDLDSKINISPYLKIKMTLSPSYNARKWFKWKIPKIKINTTINLTDIYSR